MASGSKTILRFVLSWIINTIAVLVAAEILSSHIHYDRDTDLVVAALLLGILNAFVRPILMLLALPLLIFTLGLFTFVINGLLLYFVGYLLQPHFYVDSFRYAFLGAFIISLISLVLNFVTGNNRNISVTRQQRPPDRGPGGNGPVIDV
jgi:putative membrane protein